MFYIPTKAGMQTSHQNVEQFVKISKQARIERKHMSETSESANI
jgi:hypothetical protein